jgi:hypothetical protein
VAGGKGGCFIEKKELGPAAATHNRTPPPFPRQSTRDPCFRSPPGDDLLFLVMDDAAIPGQSTACSNGTQFPPRINAIL